MYIATIGLIALCVLIVLSYLIANYVRNNQKPRNPFDRLHHSEKQLLEYKSLSTDKKIEEFETLKRAIGRLHSILNRDPDATYEKQEILNWDFLHTDVEIIPYLDENYNRSYMKQSLAVELPYPEEGIQVIDESNGKYIIDGEEKYSIRLAIGYSLTMICVRWLNEIAEIENAISVAE